MSADPYDAVQDARSDRGEWTEGDVADDAAEAFRWGLWRRPDTIGRCRRMSRDECAAASPRWGNGGGSCTCSGYARPGEPAVFDSSRCPVHAKPLPEARSAAQLSDERLDDLLHDAELLVEGASHGLRIPAIQWEDDVLVALRELKKKREALRAIDTYDKRLLIDQGRSLQAHIEEALRDAD